MKTRNKPGDNSYKSAKQSGKQHAISNKILILELIHTKNGKNPI